MDKIITALQANPIGPSNMSVGWVNNIARADKNIWEQLGRGRAIPSTEEQLDQYLWSYGPMVKCQWDKLTASVVFDQQSCSIIDYGCGQGLAGCHLMDRVSWLRANVSQMVLIEPSPVGLRRAEALMKAYCPNAAIQSFNTKLDQVEEKDIGFVSQHLKIHLFSNILDVEGFHLGAILTKALSKGTHLFLAVGNVRKNSGGARTKIAYEALIDPKYSDKFKVQFHDSQNFTCRNGIKCIFFAVDLVVS